MLLMGIGTMKALAADYLYVITDGNGNYLANSSGSIANATSFDPKTCVWTCTGNSSGTLVNNSYYLRYNSKSLSITSTSNQATTWTISDNNVLYKSRTSTYYISYTSSAWSVNTTLTNGANIYTVTKLTTDAVSSMTLDYDAGRKSNKLGGENVFEREGDSRDYTIDLSYTPAYNTYSWTTTDNAKVKYYTSSDDSYITNTAAPEAITEATSCVWSSNYPDNITFLEEDESSAMATYKTKFSTDTEVTITASATISKDKSSFMTANATLTATDTVTLLSHNLVGLSLGVDSPSLYVGQTTQIKYDGWYDVNAKVTYTSGDTSIVEVSNTGKITAKGTGSDDSKRVMVTVSMAETSDYEAGSASITITVSKHPTTMSLSYDKSALTYGDTAPALPALTLKDNVDNSDIANASVSYSSNNTCVNVNASTGELTILSAGTATITAQYQGDGTHVKAVAKFTVTVSKATTTLTFEQSGYIAQTTHEFTSPVATLTPAEAGSVTYSYTSSTDGLITLDANTGAVTLNTLTGTATATVTATFAGNDKYEPATASYVLTVTSKEIPDLEVTTEIEFYVDATYKIQATTTASAGITFESNDTDVITVGSDGTLNAVGEG